MPGTVERVNRFVWPAATNETNPDLKRSFVYDAETLRRAILDAVWRVAEGGVTRECLADGAVPESALETALQKVVGIEDGSITVRKLATAVLAATVAGRAKMADQYLTAAKFVARTITSAKLASSVGAYAIPVGTMAWFGGETAPYGWFECNGQEKKIADYPALAAVCGTRWGTASGGSLWFKLPDIRGYFERGWAHGSSNDPDRASRVGGDHVGSTQADAFEGHVHKMLGQQVTWTSGALRPSLFCPPATTSVPLVTVFAAQSTNTESRPQNKYAMKIIKW